MGDEGRHPFERQFFAPGEVFTTIGKGEIGGKAQGLLRIQSALDENYGGSSSGIEVGIPRFTVLTTEVFDAFMARNGLGDMAGSDSRDQGRCHVVRGRAVGRRRGVNLSRPSEQMARGEANEDASQVV